MPSPKSASLAIVMISLSIMSVSPSVERALKETKESPAAKAEQQTAANAAKMSKIS